VPISQKGFFSRTALPAAARNSSGDAFSSRWTIVRTVGAGVGVVYKGEAITRGRVCIYII